MTTLILVLAYKGTFCSDFEASLHCQRQLQPRGRRCRLCKRHPSASFILSISVNRRFERGLQTLPSVTQQLKTSSSASLDYSFPGRLPKSPSFVQGLEALARIFAYRVTDFPPIRHSFKLPHRLAERPRRLRKDDARFKCRELVRREREARSKLLYSRRRQDSRTAHHSHHCPPTKLDELCVSRSDFGSR